MSVQGDQKIVKSHPIFQKVAKLQAKIYAKAKFESPKNIYIKQLKKP